MYMGIDQFGQTFHGLEYPRRDLMRCFDRQRASKMYVDKLDGSTVHIGYIVAGHWVTVYSVERMERI